MWKFEDVKIKNPVASLQLPLNSELKTLCGEDLEI